MPKKKTALITGVTGQDIVINRIFIKKNTELLVSKEDLLHLTKNRSYL